MEFDHNYSQIVYCNDFHSKPKESLKAKVAILKKHRFGNSDMVFNKKLVKFNTEGIPYIIHQRLFWELIESTDTAYDYITTGRVQNVHDGTEFGHRIETVYTLNIKNGTKERRYVDSNGKDRFDVIIGSSRHSGKELFLKERKVIVKPDGMLYARHNRFLYEIRPNHTGKSDYITTGRVERVSRNRLGEKKGNDY